MFFSSPTSNITPASTSVAMSRSDSRDTTSSTSNYFSYAPTSAYSALINASPGSHSHPLIRSDSTCSSTSTTQSQSPLLSSTAMRRDSSNSSWAPSPYRSCLSSFGTEPSSYLSDDDLLFTPEELALPIESIPTPTPKKELTTEEQIALLRELQAKETAHFQHHQQVAAAAMAHQNDSRRKVVRFAPHGSGDVSTSRRSSTTKRRQPLRRGHSQLNGPQ